MFCVAAELAALALAGPRLHTEIDAAASHLGSSFEAAQERARTSWPAQIGDAIAVIYGSDLTAPVAYRWKCQINENAKESRVLRCAARGRPQRARGLVGAPTGASRRSSSATATSIRGSASASS